MHSECECKLTVIGMLAFMLNLLFAFHKGVLIGSVFMSGVSLRVEWYWVDSFYGLIDGHTNKWPTLRVPVFHVHMHIRQSWTVCRERTCHSVKMTSFHFITT